MGTEHPKKEFPKAFRITKESDDLARGEHEHTEGAAAPPPCPPACTYVGQEEINGKIYCVYDCDGSELLILC